MASNNSLLAAGSPVTARRQSENENNIFGHRTLCSTPYTRSERKGMYSRAYEYYKV